MNDQSQDLSELYANIHVERDSRFVHIRRATKLWQLGCYMHVIDNYNVDVVVCIDADDWLPDPFVFNRILQAYADPTVWMTYGSYALSDPVFPIGNLGKCNGEITDFSTIRTDLFRASHLKTFRRFLFDHVDNADLLGPDGEIVKASCDQAIILPMLEMAGPTHSRHLSSINYIYNKQNPSSVSSTDRKAQIDYATFIRSKTPYSPL